MKEGDKIMFRMRLIVNSIILGYCAVKAFKVIRTANKEEKLENMRKTYMVLDESDIRVVA